MTRATVLIGNLGGRLPVGEVPAFSVMAGQILCLHTADPSVRNQERRVARQLGPLASVAEPLKLPSFAFRTPTVSHFLEKNLSRKQLSESVLKRIGLSGAEDIRQVGMTDRLLLAIEAVFSHKSIVVLTLAGLDPVGHDRVVHHLAELISQNQRAAILVSYPTTEGWKCSRLARCVVSHRP